MKWSKNRRPDRREGYWICRVKANEATRRYRQTPKGKAATLRYRQSDKARANDHHYNRTEKGRARQQRRRDKMTWRQKHLNQLRTRRYKALQRQAKRHEREERSG